MKRIALAVLSLCVVLTAVGAGDVLQELGVAKDDAGQRIIRSLALGNVDYYVVRNAMKSAAPSARAALVEQVLIWTKAYVNSPQFAKDYAAARAEAKPEALEQGSVDEELKARREQQKRDEEEQKRALAEMPPEVRKIAEQALKEAAEAAKQIDAQQLGEIERAEVEGRQQEEQTSYKQALAEWNAQYPADAKSLVRKRLAEFLARTADVDYDAKTANRGGRMRFVNADYEAKDSDWKLAYRAGKETTERARAYAKTWLAELK
ncbi:MAG: hypothetical protein M3Q69_11150 [Acidobacteriota bacterium]|nr:hypothetical protein [Acidobacteriota bacterium]